MSSFEWPNHGSGSSGGVTSLNGLIGALNLIAGSNITITPSGSNITIASTGGGSISIAGENYLSLASSVLTAHPVNLSNTNVTGNLPVSHLDSGTNASNQTFWRGDGHWFTPPTASPSGNLQLQYDNSGVFGGVPGSIVNPSIQNLSLTAADQIIPDPQSFNITLITENLASGPTGNASLIYGPQDNGSGSGTENPGYTGYTSNDTVQATVFSYRIVNGQQYISPGGIDLGTVTLVNNPSGIDWVWTAETNGDGSAVDGYVIQIVDETTSTVNSFDIPGGFTLTYADQNNSGTVSYPPFGGIFAAGQTINYSPYTIAPSPSNNPYYAAGTLYSVTDSENNGSFFWVQHTINQGSVAQWRILEDVSSAGFDGSGSQTFNEMALFTGDPTVTPNHYGILSDGSALSGSWEVYSNNSTLGIYSSGALGSTTTDPNDGQYYYFDFQPTMPSGPNLAKIIHVDNSTGQLYNISSGINNLFLDALGPSFLDGITVTPTVSTNTPLTLNNDSQGSNPAPVLILESNAGTDQDVRIQFNFGTSEKGILALTDGGDFHMTPAINGSLVLKGRQGGGVPGLYQQTTSGTNMQAWLLDGSMFTQQVKVVEGTNAAMGIATLSGGTVTVSTSKVTANSRIFLTTDGGTLTHVGTPYISSRSVSVSFTITSTNALDVSNVAWIIIEPV